jgi:hypothetical protein
MLVKQPMTGTVKRIIETHFELDVSDTRIAGLVVLNSNHVLISVYPMPKFSIVIGSKDTVTEARNEEDIRDGSTITYYESLAPKLSEPQAPRYLGAYIKVGDDNEVLEFYPQPGKLLLTINWVPGFPPKSVESMEVGTIYGQATKFFDPLMDLLEELHRDKEDGDD